jgi:hypothetical protein
MRINPSAAVVFTLAATSPLFLNAARPETRIIRVVDTVFVAPRPIDYDELARRVLTLAPGSDGPTVIDGDLIVKGRLGVGGEPEPETGYAVTVHGRNDASIRLISNEALKDPQRDSTQHRHVGTLSLAQDGGLRLDQNGTCYPDSRGCVADDRRRRHAYTGYDSMGDMSFYLSDVDSLSGKDTAPRAQSMVFHLLDWDNHIHISSHRPGQRIFFNASKLINATDLQWEVPFPGAEQTPRP